MTDPKPNNVDENAQAQGEEVVDIATVSKPLPNFVVGIGASAGGLEALELLFEHMPVNLGMAFVVIQHLSPTHKSMMDELLARKTQLRILVAENKMELEADVIYLLPPNREMIVANNRLLLTEREQNETLNLPINIFFRSLAECFQDKSIAIVLSGTGSDGSKGLVAVHDSGGFVIAQSPETCGFDSMPQNAIETKFTDLVLAPKDIPAALVKYSSQTTKIEQQFIIGEYGNELAEFSEVVSILHNRFNLDFAQYKPSTITRRLQRRLTMQGVNSLSDYIKILHKNPMEIEALYYDLLIGVTRFFRDQAAFDLLLDFLPDLVKSFPKETELRVWIAACATGQEAYTMSMLLYDFVQSGVSHIKSYKIYATDIHNKSIQTAAAGIYNEMELEGLSERDRERFFSLVNEGQYLIKPHIRTNIVFAQHNLLKDPPFTRTHMVNCRNLLIYFNAKAQQQALSLMTFSLMNQGLLFLGPSETISNHAGDYQTLDSNYRIFRKTKDSKIRLNMPLSIAPRPVIKPDFSPTLKTDPIVGLKTNKALEALLQQFVPPSLLINAQGAILHVFGDAGKYLSLNFGTPSVVLQDMVGLQARSVVNHMLHYVLKHKKSINSMGVSGLNNVEHIDISMRLLSTSQVDDGYVLVCFETSKIESDERLITSDQQDPQNVAESAVILDTHHTMNLSNVMADDRIKELEDELQAVQETLQVTVEELEASNEELQASNEELMSSNEELQSTNEELQSVNEELYTVNAEFQKKESERIELQTDEQSILSESNIGVVFLDKTLRLRKMSHNAAKLFSLQSSDIGGLFAAGVNPMVSQLYADIQTVFKGGVLVERELTNDIGDTYLVRINALFDHTPKVDAQHQVQVVANFNGVVITLVDVTQYRALQNTLERNEKRFSSTINAVADSYFEWNLVTNDCFFPASFAAMLGYVDERLNLEQLLAQGVYNELKTNLMACLSNNGDDKGENEQSYSYKTELPFITKAGDIKWMIFKGSIEFNLSNDSQRFVGILIDFTEQKLIELRLDKQARELERSNLLLEQFADIVSHDMKAPLRRIRIYLTFLQEAIEAEDFVAVNKEMAILRENAEELDALIDDIITYSRVNSEVRKVIDVELDEVIDNIVKMLDTQIVDGNVQINCSPLPCLRGDKAFLTHLFQNLMTNAIKYTDKTAPVIDIGHEIVGTDNVISVTDNGIGFDPEYADKVFLPFKRLVTRDEFDGNGIGLSICKTAVEQHGGRISVDSTPGKGSCFKVILPIELEER